MTHFPLMSDAFMQTFLKMADGIWRNLNRCYYMQVTTQRSDWPEPIPWAVFSVNMRDAPEPIRAKANELRSLITEHGYITERHQGSSTGP